MTIDFSVVKTLFTDSNASGLFMVSISPLILDEIQHFAEQSDFKVCRLDFKGVDNENEIEHRISEAIGYSQAFYHDAVWDGLFDFMPVVAGDLDFANQTKGYILLVWGIDEILTRLERSAKFTLELFRDSTDGRKGKAIPMYVLFMLDKDEQISPQLQAEFNAFAVNNTFAKIPLIGF